MSANNQTLVKEHRGKWYVFSDIVAESWGKKNILKKEEADFVYDNPYSAWKKANKVNNEIDDFGYGIEYGVSDRLIKDRANVSIK